jgi:DNA mismatch repair ATPase MutL
MEEQRVSSQKLLLPQTFALPTRDAEWVERNISTLQKMGIGIENFGPNTLKIEQLIHVCHRGQWRPIHAIRDRRTKKHERQQFTLAFGRRYDSENGVPSRCQSQ